MGLELHSLRWWFQKRFGHDDVSPASFPRDADKGHPSIPGCGLALLRLYFGGMYRPRDPSHLDDPRFRTGKRVGLGVGFLLTPIMAAGFLRLAEIDAAESTFFFLISATCIGMFVGMIGGGLGAKHFFTSSSDSGVKGGVNGDK